jgi:hypothetical protein
MPEVVPAPGRVTAGGNEIEATLFWFFLPEDPVPTGSGPSIVVGVDPPCGFKPKYGSVGAPVSPLKLRVRVRRPAGTVAVSDGGCVEQKPLALLIPSQRLRLGTFELAPGALPDGGVGPPRTLLRVIEDDPSLPDRMARRIRLCTPGDDSSCTAGGVCATVPGRSGRGICVPPIDPYVSAQGRCQQDWSMLQLDHSGPYAMGATPEPGPLSVCLPSCESDSVCGSLKCEALGMARVCLPP